MLGGVSLNTMSLPANLRCIFKAFNWRNQSSSLVFRLLAHSQNDSVTLQVISGRKKFIVQLNNRWNAQFLKEFENNFLEPLGFLKSNYMKNCKEEILFCVCQGEKESSELLPLIVLPKDGVLIIANVSMNLQFIQIKLKLCAEYFLSCGYDWSMSFCPRGILSSTVMSTWCLMLATSYRCFGTERY